MTEAGILGLIFDFGGVLWNMRWDVAKALEAAHGVPVNALAETLYRTPTWAALERGVGDREAWLEEAHRLLEARVARSLPRLHEAWRATQQPIAETISLLHALRPSYRMAILSNADASLRSRLRDGLGIPDLFDDIICSAEVGIAKPEPAIYRLVAARLGLPAEACVFVDDSEPNVEAARAIGMRGVFFRVDRGDDLRTLLAAHGVVPAPDDAR
ncbi:MAG: HAD family hydrolase [Candidatus Rokuibacteriota bacterium]